MAIQIKMRLGEEEHILDLESMLISEARLLKKHVGWDYLTWRQQLGQSDPDAVAFAWWIAKRRSGEDPGPFMDLDFDMAALDAEAVVDEEPEAEEDDTDTDLPTGFEMELATSPT